MALIKQMTTWKLLTMLTYKLILTLTLMTLFPKLRTWKNSGSPNRIGMKEETLTTTMILTSMITANNVDQEVNSNCDSEDSDSDSHYNQYHVIGTVKNASEAEHYEKMWQRQQNWTEDEEGDTDTDDDAYEDRAYELLQANFIADFAKTEYKLQMLQQQRPSQCIASLMTGQKLQQPFDGPQPQTGQGQGNKHPLDRDSRT